MNIGLNNSFLSPEALASVGFAGVGRNVLVHPLAVIHGAQHIILGDNVRIDPFALVSAACELRVGSYSHVHSHCSLIAAAPLRMGAFCNLSHGVILLTVCDDFRGSALLGAMVPESLRNTRKEAVTLEDHVNIGANSVLLPGAYACEGSALGALSLAKGRLDPWTLYAGIPARRIGQRSNAALGPAAALMAHNSASPDGDSDRA